MKQISSDAARRIGNKLGVDWKQIPLSEFQMGLGAELEHVDVTKGELLTTGKIALAHLKERPDYYTLLKWVEKLPPLSEIRNRPDYFSVLDTLPSVPDKKWNRIYATLIQLARRHGLSVKEVDELQGYAAMQPEAAKPMGFKGKPNTIYILRESSIERKCFDLAHELFEHYRMKHFDENYWTAHTASMKAEYKGERMFPHVARVLNGRKRCRRITKSPTTSKVRR